MLALDQCLNEAKIQARSTVWSRLRRPSAHHGPHDPLAIPPASLISCIDELIKGLSLTEQAGRVWRLPVCYDERLSPDLAEVATRTNLSPAQVIERHSAITYHVYMLGFLPGQAYMGDLPAELNLPRRATPRLKIPAGSLAIAMSMTCIFPLESPCGWHLIGRSPIPLWDGRPGVGALLTPGDQVNFIPVSLREYEDLLAKVVDGTLEVVPRANAKQPAKKKEAVGVTV